MHPKDVLRHTMNAGDLTVNTYIADLDDADLLIRPVDGMNPIAWQLGHLIASERMFVETIQAGSCPPLPEGFEEAHDQEATKDDDPSKYLSRAKYQELWKAQRAATEAVLDRLPDEQLDAPSEGPIAQIAPTLGAVFNMVGVHALMHAGQFVAVRRKLGKPVTI